MNWQMKVHQTPPTAGLPHSPPSVISNIYSKNHAEVLHAIHQHHPHIFYNFFLRNSLLVIGDNVPENPHEEN